MTLEPIPRVAKRKRKIDPEYDQDLLTGFNYVAPQHSEDSLADLCSTHTSTFHSTCQIDLGESGTSAAISFPVSSGKTSHSGQSQDKTHVASIEEEKKHLGGTLKQRCWNWKRSPGHDLRTQSRTGTAANEEKVKVYTATTTRHRQSRVSTICRGILLNGKPTTNIIIR